MKNMKNSKNKNNGVSAPEIFFVWSDELQDRFDPFFYRPVFKKLLEVIANNKTAKIMLKEAITNSYAGEWGEDPIDFEPNPDYELCYVVRNTNFHNDFNLDFSDVAQRYIKKSKAEKIALKKGDILIEKSGGSPIQPVGRVALVDDLPFDKPVVFSNFLQKMEVNKELFLPEYIFVYLQALYKTGYMDFIQNQTTGIKNLRLDDFFKILIIKPSIAEQKKVAMKAIESREEARGLLEKAKTILASIDSFVLGELGIEIEREREELAFAITSDEIEGRIDPFFYKPYLRNLVAQIKSKKHFKLSEAITEISGGATPKVTEDYYLDEGGIPFLRVQNITEMGINLDDVKFIKPEVHETMLKRSQLKRDDLVFTITGRIGSVAVVPDNFEGNINQHSVRFHLRDKIKDMEVLPEYVASFFNTNVGRDLSFRYTTGGTRPALDYEALRSLVVPLPELKTQEKIVAGVKTIYNKARNLRQEAETVIAEAQKQTAEMIFA